MKFKVGDKVRVREDLEVDKEYGNLCFVGSMEEYKSKELTISRVWDDCYILKGASFFWTDEMLEPVEEGEKSMNIEKLNEEYKNKMDALMEEYKAKVKEVTEEEEPFIKEGQRYFTIDNYFRILTTKNFDCEDDAERIQIGNCYPFTDENREEVYREVNLITERRKLQSQMEMFARQNNEGKIDWNNDEQMKWSLCIEHNETIVIDYGCYYRQLNTVYFTSKELAEKALDKFSSRIKKLYIDSEDAANESTCD